MFLFAFSGSGLENFGDGVLVVLRDVEWSQFPAVEIANQGLPSEISKLVQYWIDVRIHRYYFIELSSLQRVFFNLMNEALIGLSA